MSTTLPPSGGIVGSRVLHGFQLIDIGRLQSQLTILRPSSFVAVFGLGPTDSNETGKTTMLAALDLLQASRGWGMHLGQAGPFAADLLFRGSKRSGTGRAEHGYIVGIYGPETNPVDLTGAPNDHITIWMRVNRTSPYIQVRHTSGVVLARGDSHAETIADADRIWNDQLPSRPMWGEKQYVEHAFGGLPRVTGYVARRGGKPPKHVSLVTTALEQLDPLEIGDELIDLAGLRGRIVTERTARAALRPLQEKLTGAETGLANEEAKAAQTLAEMDALKSAVDGAQAAAETRRTYELAKASDAARRIAKFRDERDRILASVDRQQLEQDIATLSERIGELEDVATLEEQLRDAIASAEKTRPAAEEADAKLEELSKKASGVRYQLERPELTEQVRRHRGRDLVDIEAELAEKTSERSELELQVRLVERDRDAARDHADAVREGRGSPVKEVLEAAGIAAHVVVDVAEPDDEHGQLRLSALLAPFIDAVAVDETDRGRALAALRDHPGALLVAGSSSEPPVAGVTAPTTARPILRWLLDEQAETGTAGIEAVGPVTVVGGFAEPQIGRAARLQAAESQLRAADTKLERLTGQLSRAKELERDLADERTYAYAAATQVTLKDELDAAEGELRATREDTAEDRERHQQAEAAVREARAAIEGQESQLEIAKDRLEIRQATFRQQVEQPLKELSQQAAKLDLRGWLDRVAGSGDEETDPEGTSLTALTRELPRGEIVDMVDATLSVIRETLDAELEARTGGPADQVEHENLRRAYNRRINEALASVGVRFDTRIEAGVERTVVEADNGTPRQVVEAARRRDIAREQDTPKKLEAFDHLVEVVTDVYGPQVETDAVRRRQIEETLEEFRGRVASATENLDTQRRQAETLQSTLEQSLRGAFDDMSEQFARQLRADQGEDGFLKHEPVIPADGSDEPLRWRVEPHWSRMTGGQPQSYRPGENTGQEKLKAVQLLLAALRFDATESGTGLSGRMLILDELGATLGAEHRQLVLGGLAKVAREHGVTILATVQDDLYAAAAARAGEVLVLRYQHRDEDLNDPTRMMLAGPDRRLALLEEHLVEARSTAFSALTPLVASTGPSSAEPEDAELTAIDIPDTIPDDFLDEGPAT